MFSQFRQAVESLAQPPPRSSQDLTDDEHRRSRSQDSQGIRQSLHSAQLAESALQNLRKSLTSQRSGSLGSPSPPPNQTERRRPNLEERLKSTFIIGEASNHASPLPSSRASTPVPVAKNPMSPSSTPLPDSPALAPSNVPDVHRIIAPLALSHSPTSELLQAPLDQASPIVSQEVTSEDIKYPEAEIPLSAQSPTEDLAEEDSGGLDKKPNEEEIRVIPEDQPDSDSGVEVEQDPMDSEPSSISPAAEIVAGGPDIDSLQKRLKLVEQRFTDVSTSFKRLQAEKLAADGVLKEFTPLEGMKDAEALRDFLQNSKVQAEMSHGEIRRLNGNLNRHEERLQELRDTHRLESASQIDLIDRLRKELSESEALLKASQYSTSHLEEELTQRKTEIGQLQVEIEKSRTAAKEEEDKRVKAVSLLKTVRQKLVKAEKEREDAVKEAGLLRARENEEKEKGETERKQLRDEIEEVNADRERALAGLKTQFDREVALLKERHEREVTALRGQFELEAATTKAIHYKELTIKDSRITALENSVQNLRGEKDAFFDQLQMRQAELESTQSHMEVLQNQDNEYQYQLREVSERIALLNEELLEARRHQDDGSRRSLTSAEEVGHLLSAAEAKYESRIADMRRTLSSLERERDEAEADWSRKFREKTREMEDLRKTLDSSSRNREENDNIVDNLRNEADRLRVGIVSYQKQLADLQRTMEKTREAEDTARQRSVELQTQMSTLEKQTEELKSREGQLRLSNKTLREELRKVQSSAALLERQRNPGVGYWSSRQEGVVPESRRSTSSLSDSVSRNGSRAASPAIPTDDEEVNLEYLRNVVLQFLEHKEMRPQLVRVLSTILRFTPQETRRLIAKV